MENKFREKASPALPEKWRQWLVLGFKHSYFSVAPWCNQASMQKKDEPTASGAEMQVTEIDANKDLKICSKTQGCRYD